MAIQLRTHQADFGPKFRDHAGRFGWWAEPGVGKTIATLNEIQEQKRNGYRGKTLVLAPKSVMRSAWVRDGKHFPELKVLCVWANSKKKRRELIDFSYCNVCNLPVAECIRNRCGGIGLHGPDVYTCNYETFKQHADDFKRNGVTRLVVDESSKVKNPNAQITKAVIEFADEMDQVLLLSGTPAPNCPTEYFSQLRCIDRRVFGSNFFSFAYHFFAPLKQEIQGVTRIVGWKLMDAKRDEFYDRLSRRSWTLRKADCLDLPAQQDIIRDIELTPPERKMYDDMLETFCVEFGDGSKVSANVGATLMKLRQITGGGIVDGPTYRAFGNSKLDAMFDILEEIGPAEACVIWGEFTGEIDRLVRAVRDSGRSCEKIDGTVKGSDRDKHIESFQAGRLKTLVCHPAAAGHGITLTAAAYTIYFSHSFSFEQHQQSRDRIYRIGQERPVTYYHLIATDTVDEYVFKALGNKRGMHDVVMDILKDRRKGNDGSYLTGSDMVVNAVQ